MTEEINLAEDKIIKQGMLQKKSLKLPIWTDRYGVLLKRNLGLILYTFYSEDFSLGATKKFFLGNYAPFCNPTKNAKSFLFNKDNSFNMKGYSDK